MAVTVNQLVVFLTVARSGSVTAAAKELYVTQPSVSSALSGLQRELSVKLMERDGRTLRPTAAGEAFLPYATDVLGLLNKGARAAQDAATSAHRTLRVGAVTTAGEFLVPTLLRAFRAAHPALEIVLAVGNREDIFSRLVNHEVDVAISGRVPDHLPLEGTAFAPNEFVLITWPGDPLAKLARVDLQEVADRPWLLRETGSGTRIMCEEYLASHGVDAKILTLGSNGAIKGAAGLGLGVALQSRYAVQMELELGTLATIRVTGGLPQRAWHVVRSTVGPQRSDVTDFIEFARSRAARQALARLTSTDA
jgi:DNA-binding transcriptional LysR family regulator